MGAQYTCVPSAGKYTEATHAACALALQNGTNCDTLSAHTPSRRTTAMSLRRALIVDDSKSARVVLSRMLAQHNLEVDAVESAEQALEYLTAHCPDVIFMDHLMPGMDGFQAVQAIKNNPRTATIPIMMYTSQEGDLYVGQARALGAMGVLPKELKPVDVSKVLNQLNLTPERQGADVARVAEARTPNVVVMAESTASQSSSQYAAGHGRGEAPPVRSSAAELRAQIESLIKEQTTELRRFVIASLDSYTSRVVSDLRGASAEPAAPTSVERPPEPRRMARYVAIGASVAAVALGGCAIWFALNLAYVKDQYATLLGQTSRLEQSNHQLETMMSQLSDAVAERRAGISNVPSLVLPEQTANDVPPAAATGSVTIETVPYGEVPLAGPRVESVRTLFSQLEAQSFRGTLRVEIFPGKFCLVGGATDGYSTAPDELAYAKCELVGNPVLDNMTAAQRQSLAFVNMIADAEKRSGGAIRINVVGGNAERLAAPYPNSAAEGMTAGQWNRAASANNRIEMTAVPGT
jgi:CheY-like chemotaxis protein